MGQDYDNLPMMYPVVLYKHACVPAENAYASTPLILSWIRPQGRTGSRAVSSRHAGTTAVPNIYRRQSRVTTQWALLVRISTHDL